MDDVQVCRCYLVTQKEITDAISSCGYATVTEIQDALGAGTMCGRCIPEIRGILASTEK
jgi:assimilatory nitrate reductase catalytic subunit